MIININNESVKVISYFQLGSLKKYYILYITHERNVLFLGNVISNGDNYEIKKVSIEESFILKRLLNDFVDNKMDTVKGYGYKEEDISNKNITYIDSQRIKTNNEKLKKIVSFIEKIKNKNDEILKEAKDEYYIQVIDQKQKERRTIIILLTILIIVLSLIFKMIFDFLN